MLIESFCFLVGDSEVLHRLIQDLTNERRLTVSLIKHNINENQGDNVSLLCRRIQKPVIKPKKLFSEESPFNSESKCF